MSITVNIIPNDKIKNEVAKLSKVASSFRGKAHDIAVSSLIHVVKHRNVELINNVCDIMKNMAHNNAMIRWYETYANGAIKWNTKDKAFKVNTALCDVLCADDETMQGFIDNLVESKPYYELTKAPEFKAFIFAEEVAKLIKRAQKRAEESDERDNFEGINDILNALKNVDQSIAAKVMH